MQRGAPTGAPSTFWPRDCDLQAVRSGPKGLTCEGPTNHGVSLWTKSGASALHGKRHSVERYCVKCSLYCSRWEATRGWRKRSSATSVAVLLQGDLEPQASTTHTRRWKLSAS